MPKSSHSLSHSLSVCSCWWLGCARTLWVRTRISRRCVVCINRWMCVYHVEISIILLFLFFAFREDGRKGGLAYTMYWFHLWDRHTTSKFQGVSPYGPHIHIDCLVSHIIRVNNTHRQTDGNRPSARNFGTLVLCACVCVYKTNMHIAHWIYRCGLVAITRTRTLIFVWFRRRKRNWLYFHSRTFRLGAEVAVVFLHMYMYL